MKELTVINKNGVLLTDSREVAEMIGKEHKNLLRDIQGYIKVIEDSSKLSRQDFFIESTYQNSQNKTQPCYLLTKQGCEMVANKMTGEKGILFTAEYVKRFNIMEECIKEAVKENEYTLEDKITKLLSAIPECDRTAAMFKLVDRFYPENNNTQPIPEAKYDTNKSDKTVLTDEFLIQVIKEHYNDLYIRDITHKGVDCITIYKKKLIKIFEDMGITKKELFRFLRTKNYIFYAQVRHGYVPKNHWEYFIEKDFFNK